MKTVSRRRPPIYSQIVKRILEEVPGRFRDKILEGYHPDGIWADLAA